MFAAVLDRCRWGCGETHTRYSISFPFLLLRYTGCLFQYRYVICGVYGIASLSLSWMFVSVSYIYICYGITSLSFFGCLFFQYRLLFVTLVDHGIASLLGMF